MELGNLILKYRKQKNLSQEDLANLIGVTRQTISKWELNETTPDLKQAIKLAELFGISINDLIKSNQINEVVNDIGTNNKFKIIIKIMKIIGITISIIIFVICMYIILTTYIKGYFSTGPTSQGVSQYCDYNGSIKLYEVWRYYDSNQIVLNTEDEEIMQKFKSYDYVNEQKMLADIVTYIESNGGVCGINKSSIDASEYNERR